MKSATHARITSLFEFSLEQAILAFSQKSLIPKELKSYENTIESISLLRKMILSGIFLS